MTPHEVWDEVVEGVPLHRAPRNASFGRRLLQVAARRFPSARDVVLTGGGASSLALEHCARRNVTVIPAVYAAERAGLAWLREHGRYGWVVDLGQSAIKISDGRERVRVERDLREVPVHEGPASPEQRDAFVSFVARALRSGPARRPSAMVLALPCEVSSAIELATCTYPWNAGDSRLVGEILARAHIETTCVVVGNDAELAAASVLCEREVVHPTVVLTIGYGIGAALLSGRES